MYGHCSLILTVFTGRLPYLRVGWFYLLLDTHITLCQRQQLPGEGIGHEFKKQAKLWQDFVKNFVLKQKKSLFVGDGDEEQL